MVLIRGKYSDDDPDQENEISVERFKQTDWEKMKNEYYQYTSDNDIRSAMSEPSSKTNRETDSEKREQGMYDDDDLSNVYDSDTEVRTRKAMEVYDFVDDIDIENDPDKGFNTKKGFFKPTEYEKDGSDDLLDLDETYAKELEERRKNRKHKKDGIQSYSIKEHTMKYVNFTWVDKDAILCKHCKNKLYLNEHIYRNNTSSVFIKAKYSNYLMLNVEDKSSNNLRTCLECHH